MRKAMLIILMAISIMLVTVSCKSAIKVESEHTECSVLINDGSIFVYTFRDPTTGVWYISCANSVTPRLNADGTLYVK